MKTFIAFSLLALSLSSCSLFKEGRSTASVDCKKSIHKHMRQCQDKYDSGYRGNVN